MGLPAVPVVVLTLWIGFSNLLCKSLSKNHVLPTLFDCASEVFTSLHITGAFTGVVQSPVSE